MHGCVLDATQHRKNEEGVDELRGEAITRGIGGGRCPVRRGESGAEVRCGPVWVSRRSVKRRDPGSRARIGKDKEMRGIGCCRGCKHEEAVEKCHEQEPGGGIVVGVKSPGAEEEIGRKG
ncbi:hypothetical protein L7F22_017559 [Adiantum nelumboides]|nr:hypothetical protein [Adiantum nelumboides]